MAWTPSRRLGGEFRVGAWRVRPGEGRITGPGGDRRLRPMLMDLLVLLVERGGQVVSKDAILDQLRGSRFVGESVLSSDIAELRRLQGWAYVGQHRFGDAVAAFQKAVSLAPDAYSAAGLAHAFARGGEPAPASRTLDEMTARSSSEYVPDVIVAIIAAGMGDRDAAFERLERCYEARDPHMFWLAVMPAFEPLREDARYHDLLGRVRVAPRSWHAGPPATRSAARRPAIRAGRR